MKATKRKRLESSGWTVGTAETFLGLSKEEAEFIELKLTLSRTLRKRRESKKLSQAQFAKLLGSSQSRVAKMEAADPTVSLDLLVRSLLAIGSSRGDLARVIGFKRIDAA